MTHTDGAGRPLIVTADSARRDGLLRLCAAVGVTPDVAADVAAARRAWPAASCVVVGTDCLGLLVGAVDRRDGIAIIAPDAPADTAQWANAVAIGAEGMYALPDDEAAIVELLASSADRGDRDAVVLGVVGGSGGCGASTVAAALAISAARQHIAALLVDADPLGGGIDILVGNEDARGLRWPDLAATQGRVNGESLRQVLPRASDLSVLSWDRGDLDTIPPESMHSVLSAGRRSHDLVVVDVPRHLDAAAEEAVGRANCLLLVVSAEIRAIAAAQRVLARLRPHCGDIRLVVRGPGPTGLGADVVAGTLAVPLAATLRADRKLAELVDDGLGPLARRRSPLASTCSVILDRLGLLQAAA